MKDFSDLIIAMMWFMVFDGMAVVLSKGNIYLDNHQNLIQSLFIVEVIKGQ